MTLIKTIGTTTVSFGKGKFDNWCVWVFENGKRSAPSDKTYFADLQTIGDKYGRQKVYDDFHKVYERTDTTVNPEVCTLISEISQEYKEDAYTVDKWMTVIYAGMIAEENKEHAVLKKRIKRLGMYQSLIENMPADEAANYSKGKPAAELTYLMRRKGI